MGPNIRQSRWWLLVAGAAFLGWQLLKPEVSDDLSGQVVLVTGGSRGLGLLLAREYGRLGARLVICARDPDELERARRQLVAEGIDVLALPCDVSSPTQVERLVTAALEHYGRIDVLVNNASIIQVGPAETFALQDLDKAMAINFWGSVYMTWAVLPHMRQRRSGTIVNIDSIGGRVAIPHLLPYNSAKFAMRGFAETLGAELAKDGVHVTTILPGLMRTGSTRHALFKGEHEAEYTWFSLGGSIPLTAMDAERAAREIVHAALAGTPEVTLSWQANVLGLVHDLAPSWTIRALGLVNRMLPGVGTAQLVARKGDALKLPRLVSTMIEPTVETSRQYNELSTRSTPELDR